ncbi:MAG: hypothetical protein IT158_18980 [Bryobacterales bacterium]|nr:hypothetical protein [Bryobacterales bacterium]
MKLLNFFFGCQHRRTTFPLTPARKSPAQGGQRHGTYVVCLDCGGEFAYNWQEMRVEEPVRTSATVARQMAATGQL